MVIFQRDFLKQFVQNHLFLLSNVKFFVFFNIYSATGYDKVEHEEIQLCRNPTRLSYLIKCVR